MAAYIKLGDIKGQDGRRRPRRRGVRCVRVRTDVAEPHKDHKNWINVASCNMGGHKSGDVGDDGTGALETRRPPRSLTCKSN